jgi:hypothetical protein
MLVGKLENRTPESFILSQAAFIKDTGRRKLFFAGEFDTNVKSKCIQKTCRLKAQHVDVFSTLGHMHYLDR